MMVLCFLWGQKEYRIPYAWKKLCAYIIIVVLLFFLHESIIHFFKGNFINLISATLLLILYVWFILNIEWKEFQRLPVIGKYFKAGNIVVRRSWSLSTIGIKLSIKIFYSKQRNIPDFNSSLVIIFEYTKINSSP